MVYDARKMTLSLGPQLLFPFPNHTLALPFSSKKDVQYPYDLYFPQGPTGRRVRIGVEINDRYSTYYYLGMKHLLTMVPI